LREHVRPERLLELLVGDVLERVLVVLLGGVVDEHVEATELRDDLLDGLLAEPRVSDVALDQQRAPALGLDVALHLLGVLVLLEVEDRHVGALLREVDRHGAADAAVAAGDRRDLALELAAGPVGLALVARRRDHLLLAPALPALLLGGHAARLAPRWGRLPSRRPLVGHVFLRPAPAVGAAPVGTMTPRWECAAGGHPPGAPPRRQSPARGPAPLVRQRTVK